LSHARAMLINSSLVMKRSSRDDFNVFFKRGWIYCWAKEKLSFSIFCPHGRCFVLIAFLRALHFCT